MPIGISRSPACFRKASKKLNFYGFMPHGDCFMWRPGVLWLHVLSDLGIGLAYYCIPFAIFYFIRKRRDLPFPHIFWLFGAFFLLCGTTHLLSIWVLWHANYYIEGFVKAATAIVSIATLISIIIMLPRALGLHGPADLLIRYTAAQKRADASRDQLLLQLVAKNTELERFAYVASHDMQEPLRMITNFAQVLILNHADMLDEDGKEYLGIITDSAGRMRDMVTDLLEYARLGNEGIKFGRVDTAVELRHVRENLMKLIADTGATVTAGDMPVIHGNGVELMRLLQNLIANAIKFQPAGQRPAVHIAASRENGHWLFSVHDNGLGIDPAFITEIFEPYRRLHSWHDIKGTGLGLAFCRKIIENHGGRIWAESPPGAGSTFYFTLPAAVPAQPVLITA
jgi:signal transduction histidine kinase